MTTSNKCRSLCLFCAGDTLLSIDRYRFIPRITSDCRSFESGGELYVCAECGGIQKIPNKKWLDEISIIYNDYAAYSLASGEEQLVLDASTGIPRKRSDVLMTRLATTAKLPPVTRSLDVGCGHGVTLEAMSRTFPKWHLYGYEIGTGNLDRLRSIAGFEKLYTESLDLVPGHFGFISMIHSLEHFANPFDTLCELRRKISDDGVMFIEVCNVDENPFDLVVADHLTHFSPLSLARLLERAGFRVIEIATDWIKKEISLLAAPGVTVRMSNSTKENAVFERVLADIGWLEFLLTEAHRTAAGSHLFGVFGTSIAATWLATDLAEKIDFFVDEDTNRIGKTYMGKKVLSPAQVPVASTVFLALAPILAERVRKRLSDFPWKFFVPIGNR